MHSEQIKDLKRKKPYIYDYKKELWFIMKNTQECLIVKEKEVEGIGWGLVLYELVAIIKKYKFRKEGISGMIQGTSQGVEYIGEGLLYNYN